MKQQIKVCMLGSAPAVRGGMSSVVGQILSHNWQNVRIQYISTHISGSTLKRMAVFAIGYLRLLGKLLIPGSIDVVHMHMSYKGSYWRKYYLHKLVKLFRKPDIIHLHGSEFKKFYDTSSVRTQKKIRTLLRECDRLVVLGDAWAQTVLEIEPKTHVEILRNAVKLPDECAHWNGETFEILYLGVLIPRKCVDDLLHAMALVENPSVHLTIAGSGAEEDTLRKLCSDLGLNEKVTFAGWTDGEKKKNLLESCQCLVLPSENEGLPIAILEALAAGMPVISTGVGSIPEAVLDGKNGFIVPVHDPKSMADAMAAVSASEETWQKMSENAREIAREKFDESVFFDDLNRLYTAMMGENHHV